MERKIETAQTCDMGFGMGRYLFQENTTLDDFLCWYEKNSKTWGVITIFNRKGEVVRKFDYDLYNSHNYYYHLSWERNKVVKKISFIYSWMSEDVQIYLN